VTPDEPPVTPPERESVKAREKEREHARDEAHREQLEKEVGPPASELTPDELQRASEEESLDASTTHEVVRREGVRELERSPSALAWSGLAAGLSMGLSLVAEGALRAHIADAPWRPLVTKLGYPVGFLAVILGSQQLYTENTLTPIVPLMSKRDGETLRRVLVLWGVVLVTNVLGTLLFALAAARTEAFPPELREAFGAIAREAMEGSVAARFARAVVAGWIIALMVWMLPAASHANILVIVVMTWLVGAAGLAHVIVGSVEVQYLVFAGELSYGSFLGRYFLPVLLGNTLGGVTLVAAVNHAQVASGKG
jgi:formate-nitrite transporter family protein